MAKQVLYDINAREKLTTGMEILSRAVRSTLGPTGKNVILEKKFSIPHSTKDGVTVSAEVELPDPFENMGAKVLNEVASRTDDKVGDGTSTAVVFAEAMMKEGRKYLAAGINPIALRRGIQKAVERATDSLKSQAIPIKSHAEVKQVGYIASNNDKVLGDLFAEAMQKVGNDGVITIEESKGVDTYVQVVQGMQFDKGYISPYFITQADTLSAEFVDPLIFFYEKKLSSLRDFIPVLEKIAASGKPLVIFAEDVDGDLLAGLVVNKLQGVLKVVAVKAPGFGDRRKALLEDMAILTGGKVVSEDLGITLDKVDFSDFGTAKKVVVEKGKTTIVGGGGTQKAVKARVEQLDVQMEQTTSTYDKEKFTERKAKLASGVAIIHVGGHTEAEMKERKDRANDALHATRAAVLEGIVPGGGTAPVRALAALEDLRVRAEERYGVNCVKKALVAPVRQIAENCGLDGGDVMVEVRASKGHMGFNAVTGKYTDMVKAGIIDPVQVTISALQNAGSVASLNLTTEVLVTDLKKSSDQVAGSVS